MRASTRGARPGVPKVARAARMAILGVDPGNRRGMADRDAVGPGRLADVEEDDHQVWPQRETFLLEVDVLLAGPPARHAAVEHATARLRASVQRAFDKTRRRLGLADLPRLDERVAEGQDSALARRPGGRYLLSSEPGLVRPHVGDEFRGSQPHANTPRVEMSVPWIGHKPGPQLVFAW